jgi:NADPH:quinone reductase-like Zn-dependent oxidoreductase
MKALRIHEYGGPLRLDEIPEPTAGPGQIVVRVIATSFNPIDPGRASGVMRQAFPLEFPWIPGGDVSGVVESVGSDVTDFAVGDEVFGYDMAGGAYAEKIAISTGAVAPKPSTLTHETAAAMAVVGQTAAQALQAAGLSAGQTVLIHGGSGGVGTFAIQLAHNLGAHVITTALDSQSGALLKLGAERVIDYKQSRFEDETGMVDAVLDLVGGDVQARSIPLIKPGGVLVTSNQPPDAEQCEAHHIKGVMVQVAVKTQGLADFAAQVVSGAIIPLIAQTKTLWDPEHLWTKPPAGSALGKIVFIQDAG